jgi:hypothetical protein
MEATKDLGFEKIDPPVNGLMASLEAREIAEMQAAYIIAKKFPRDRNVSEVNIYEACKSHSFAEKAIYAYPKGNGLVTGPSIRLAEVIAQCWGNIKFGVKELSRNNGSSLVEVFAIDLQTNTVKPMVFTVPHTREKRDKKTGLMIKIPLTDDRDIYEIVANMASRRLRNCILAILPSVIVKNAVKQCEETMESSEIPMTERIQIMVKKFHDQGIKVEHLEKRLGHKLDATIASELVTLHGIYKSIKDGFASREDFFDISVKSSATDAESTLKKILDEKQQNAKKEKPLDDKKQE